MKNRLRVITTAEFISYLPLLAIRENYAAKKNSCCYLYIRLIGGAADDPSPCQFQSRIDDCNVACIYNSIIIIVIIIARSSYSIYTWWSSVCVVCVCRAALTMSSIVTVVHHIIARRYIVRHGDLAGKSSRWRRIQVDRLSLECYIVDPVRCHTRWL